MRIIYTLLLYLATPAVFARLWWRGRAAPEYRRRWPERLGRPAFARVEGAIWLHAVSVGEVQAALPLIRALQSRYPNRPLVVTTTTPTGSAQVGANLGDTVLHSYAPYDLPGAVGRFLTHIQPAVVIIMETELWPTLFHACNARAIPLLIANARLSQRSLRGYQRIAGLVRTTLAHVSGILAQSADDAQRFRALGAPPERVSVTGNLKFDLELPPDLPARGAQLRTLWGVQRPVWIAASTHEGEEAQILAAHQRVRQHVPHALLILVPRHPERFARVAELCAQAHVSCARRSLQHAVEPTTAVYLGDTMGELMNLYAAADVAYVGGSLVPHGGHNLLEPAALGLPTLTGPYTHNFSQIVAGLMAINATEVVSGAEPLAAAVISLLGDPVQRRAMGAAGQQWGQTQRGALLRVMAVVDGWVGIL